MGYFKDVEIEIMTMAHDMGDDFGDDADTILTIARALDLAPEIVQDVLQGDADRDPEEYDDSMDGDFDSGMASAGYGMDEDYA
jgi:hypothetical protein